MVLKHNFRDDYAASQEVKDIEAWFKLNRIHASISIVVNPETFMPVGMIRLTNEDDAKHLWWIDTNGV